MSTDLHSGVFDGCVNVILDHDPRDELARRKAARAVADILNVLTREELVRVCAYGMGAYASRLVPLSLDFDISDDLPEIPETPLAADTRKRAAHLADETDSV